MSEKAQLILHLADNLLEVSESDNVERLLVSCRETVAALREPLPTTLEKELGDLLSSIAEEIISHSESSGTLISRTRLALYQEFLLHVRAMAQLVTG